MAAKWVFVLCVSTVFWLATAISDHFTEELLLKPLYTEQLYAHFHFSTIWNTDYENESCKLLFS